MPTTTASERRPLLEEGRDGRPKDDHFNTVGLRAGAFWGAILSAYLVTWIFFFDSTVVATLLSSISSNFYSANNASWVGSSFLVAGACTAIIWGKLGNIIGRRAAFLLSLSIFALGTLGCAVAPDMSAFIAARVVAGLGGGGLAPLTIVVQTDTLPDELRGQFNGLFNVAVATGGAVGPAIGGPIAEHLGWRWAFGIQIPLVAICALLIARFITYENDAFWQRKLGAGAEDKSAWEKISQIDWLGASLFAATMALALVALTLMAGDTNTAHPLKWTSPSVLGPLIGSAAAAVGFVLVELYVAAEPIAPFDLLADVKVICCFFMITLASLIQFISLYTVPLFLIVVRQLTATQASSRLIIAPLLQAVGALLTGFWIKRYGYYKYPGMVGEIVTLMGSIGLCFWSKDSPEHIFWWTYPLCSLALGIVVTAAYVAITAGLGPSGGAAVVSFIWMGRLAGQVVGIAISGIVIQFTLRSELPKRITDPNSINIIDRIRKSSDSIRYLAHADKTAAIDAYQIGSLRTFYTCVGLGVVALLVTLGLQNVNIKQKAQEARQYLDDVDEDN